MKPTLLLNALIMISLVFIPTDGETRRVFLTKEQKTKLEQAQIVLVDILALTEKGRFESTNLADIVSQRLQDIGFTTHLDPSQPFDVKFKVKCEERKTWTGTSPKGGDVELADSPDRLWKGPACLLTYFLDNKDLDWKKEIRTPFSDARQAAKDANVSDPGSFAMKHLGQRLREYDFPVLLAAEWGQVNRLLDLLEKPSTPKLRQVKILEILSTMEAEEALPRLKKLLASTDLQQEALTALSGAGIESIPLLIDFFQNTTNSTLKAEAAKALGNLAAKSGDPRTIPPLVQYLSSVLPTIKTSQDIDFPLLTEVVWAIGKLRWEPSLKPVAQLQEKVWLIFDNSKAMANLREATSWTYKQLDLDGHVS